MNGRCCALLWLGGLGSIAGCQTFGGADAARGTSYEARDQSAGTPSQVDTDLDRVKRFLSGKEQINRDKAIELYRQGDDLFRQAAAAPRQQGQPMFAEAAKLFERAAEAYPGSALEQDSLFMMGESYFFADYLTRAEDAYVQLQKSHPRNRHSNHVGSRLFSISQYWIDTAKNPRPSVLPVNFTDQSRPFMDASGHGIRVLDQMRYDDPTGRLADDATMAAAHEHMRRGNFFEADQLLTDLREIYPDSDHQFMAHRLGLTCKLAMYAGAAYSGLVLEEAEKLVEQSRRIFPQELSSSEHAEFFARAAAEIEYRQAEKLWERARYREKQKHFGGANVYLQELLEKYPSTPFAERAREHLAANAEKPELPTQHLAFLAKLFPASQPQKPLVSTDGQILRR